MDVDGQLCSASNCQIEFSAMRTLRVLRYSIERSFLGLDRFFVSAISCCERNKLPRIRPWYVVHKGGNPASQKKLTPNFLKNLWSFPVFFQSSLDIGNVSAPAELADYVFGVFAQKPDVRIFLWSDALNSDDLVNSESIREFDCYMTVSDNNINVNVSYWPDSQVSAESAMRFFEDTQRPK